MDAPHPAPAAAATVDPTRRLDAWRRIGGRSLRFALLGPAVGAGVFFIALVALGLQETLRRPDEPVAAWLTTFLVFGGPVALAFGYVFGALPALLTGALAGWLAWRGHRAWHPWLVALAGGLSSAGFWIGTHPAPDLPWLVGASGLLAAAVCETWCRRREARAAPATLHR